VSGICLPILLLLGLKNGNIAQMRRDIETDPSARQILISVETDELTFEGINKLLLDINKNKSLVEMIIPLIDQSVFFSKADKKTGTVTLQATEIGDPIAKAHGVSLPEYKEGERPRVAVSEKIVKDLDAKIDDEILLHIKRNLEDGSLQTAETKVIIASVTKSDDEKKEANYVPLGFIQKLKQYANGEQVLSFGWVTANLPPRDTYAGYLLFTRKDKPLTERHLKKLTDMNFAVKEVKDIETITLGGFLTDIAVQELFAYYLFNHGGENSEWGSQYESPSVVAEVASDIFPSVIQWNKPLEVKFKGQEISCKMYGISLPDRWIVNYLRNPQHEFWTTEDKAYSIMFPNVIVKDKAVIAISGKNEITLQVKQPVEKKEEKPAMKSETVKEDQTEVKEENPEPNKEMLTQRNVVTGNSNSVFVPAKILAYFYAHKHEAAAVDIQKGTFIAVPDILTYPKFRAYAERIDDVPEAIKKIHSLHFVPNSRAETQIIKLKEQNASLDLLVLIVGLGVFLFGVLTVVSVLYDSTERKRGTIGILRVMGVSRFGVFYFICLRSALIGVLSVGGTLLAGWGLKVLLMSNIINKLGFGSVSIIFGLSDLVIISVGALFCCCVGSLLPAAIASTMDPFDAISESRFK
jgi:ABC-type lipoprotein release transport system permease subunit